MSRSSFDTFCEFSRIYRIAPFTSAAYKSNFVFLVIVYIVASALSSAICTVRLLNVSLRGA